MKRRIGQQDKVSRMSHISKMGGREIFGLVGGGVPISLVKERLRFSFPAR